MSAVSKSRRAKLIGGTAQRKKKNVKNKIYEPEIDDQFDVEDILQLCLSPQTKKSKSPIKTKKRRFDSASPHRAKKLKRIHTPKKWVLPLPTPFETLLKKFGALEMAFCTFVGRGRSQVPLEDVSASVQSISRAKLTKTDMLRIEALAENCYTVRHMQKKHTKGHVVTVLGVALLNPSKGSIASVLSLHNRNLRKKAFRRRLESEVLRHHAEFIKEDESRKGFEDVRKNRKFHPGFKLAAVKLSSIRTKKLAPIQSHSDKVRRQVNDIIKYGKGTRLNSKKIRKELKKNLSQNEMLGASALVQEVTKKKAKKLTPNTRKRVIQEAPPALKHLSPTLLIQIKGKQKTRKIMEGNPELVLKKKRLEDVLYLTDLIRSICVSTRKMSMPYDEMLRQIVLNHKRLPRKEEIAERLQLLMEICPEFCSVKKCVTMKIFSYHRHSTLFETRKTLQKEITKLAEQC